MDNIIKKTLRSAFKNKINVVHNKKMDSCLSAIKKKEDENFFRRLVIDVLT